MRDCLAIGTRFANCGFSAMKMGRKKEPRCGASLDLRLWGNIKHCQRFAMRDLGGLRSETLRATRGLPSDSIQG